MLFLIIVVFLIVIFRRTYKLQQERNILILESHIEQHFQDNYDEKPKTVSYAGKSKLALHFKVISENNKIYKFSAISSGINYHFAEGWK